MNACNITGFHITVFLNRDSQTDTCTNMYNYVNRLLVYIDELCPVLTFKINSVPVANTLTSPFSLEMLEQDMEFLCC